MIKAAGYTDKGCIRERNEDCILVDRTRQLFIVADGMGGERGGQRASQLAVSTVQEYFSSTRSFADSDWPFGYLHDLDLVQNRMLTAIKLANRDIRSAAKSGEFAGMGSTLTVVYVVGSIAVIGSVGDSRVYLYRSGILRQITRDDSLIGNLTETGALTEAQAAIHPQRHVLTEAAGARDDVNVEVKELELAHGDRLLVCSDGAHGVLDDLIFATALSVMEHPEETTRYLVSRAKREGGPDNISCIIIDHGEDQ